MGLLSSRSAAAEPADPVMDAYLATFTEEPGYLDYGRLGPLSSTVLNEARACAEIVSRARFGSLDALDSDDERFADAVASVSGLPAEHVVFQPNTSTALMHVMFGLEGTVLLSPSEFPSMTYAAARAAQALGAVTPAWLGTDHGVVTPGEVRRQITADTVAVGVSLVDFRTGHVADLDGIRQVIGDRLLIVDAAQGFGVVDVPFEVVDVLAAPGYKWLRAGRGNGFMIMSERAIERVTPVMSGFTGVDESPFDQIVEPSHSVRAFSLSRPDPLAQTRITAALDEVARVGVGAIAARVAEHVDRIIDLVDEFAIPLESPRPLEQRAGLVVTRPAPERLTALTAALANHGVSATVREGAVRFAPHAGTAEETFDMLRGALTSYATST